MFCAFGSPNLRQYGNSFIEWKEKQRKKQHLAPMSLFSKFDFLSISETSCTFYLSKFVSRTRLNCPRLQKIGYMKQQSTIRTVPVLYRNKRTYCRKVPYKHFSVKSTWSRALHYTRVCIRFVGLNCSLQERPGPTIPPAPLFELCTWRVAMFPHNSSLSSLHRKEWQQ